MERFFEEVVNERFRDAHARLGGAEREKHPTKRKPRLKPMKVCAA